MELFSRTKLYIYPRACDFTTWSYYWIIICECHVLTTDVNFEWMSPQWYRSSICISMHGRSLDFFLGRGRGLVWLPKNVRPFLNEIISRESIIFPTNIRPFSIYFLQITHFRKKLWGGLNPKPARKYGRSSTCSTSSEMDARKRTPT